MLRTRRSHTRRSHTCRSRTRRSRSRSRTTEPEALEHDLGPGHDLAVMNRRTELHGLFGAAGIGVVGLAVGCATDSGSGVASSSSSTTGAESPSGGSGRL